MSNVVYLNAWLNCPDEVLRYHYKIQDKINEAKATFFYQMKEQGIEGYQLRLCLDRWVHSNRERIKILQPLPGS